MWICLCAKFSDENWYKELKITGEEAIIEWRFIYVRLVAVRVELCDML